jgi:putative two-component system response regulator
MLGRQGYTASPSPGGRSLTAYGERMTEPVRERVLVVDDDAVTREMLTAILERHAYRCTTTGDLAGARHWLGSAPFDLVLLDIGLPDGSGMDLIETAAREHGVVMISALDDEATTERALQLGAFGYIVKPFSANDVLIGVLGAMRQLHARREARGEVRAAQEETIQRLCAALEVRDPAAATQMSRMSGYCWHVARELGLPREERDLLRLASPMHDVGNVAVADRLLRKPSAFDPEEREEMQRHTEVGYRILAGSRAPLLRMAGTIAWTHHERWDGSGYPRGLAGEEIPLVGQIAAVADVFSALVSPRPHRPAFTREEALRHIDEGRGTLFDDAVARAFLAAEARLTEQELAPESGSGERILSAREREVLQLTSEGKSVERIAAELVVSTGTVKTHLQRIYAKLDARERAAAVAAGLRRGLID